jgi:plasmid stabilization system protein ParE
LIVALEAQQDVEAACAWYEGRRAGLGEEFLGSLGACIQVLRRSPEMHAAIHKSYRRGLLRRFPYAVYYEYIADTVTIYGVFHTSRDPLKWRVRLA